MAIDTSLIREKIIASAIEDHCAKGKPKSWISRAIYDGILSGFRQSLKSLQIKRTMRDDARRLRIHADELRDWDVGDDGATAALIDEIAAHLEAKYWLEIRGDRS